jgi:hypothetical protein
MKPFDDRDDTRNTRNTRNTHDTHDANDDLLPEERDWQHHELASALGRVYQPSMPLSDAEQGESIMRVRERMQASRAAEHQGAEQQTGTANSMPLRPVAPTALRPRWRIMTFVNGLAAVLVIGAIIGASVLLFTRHSSPGTLTPALPTGNSPGLTVVASSTVDNVTLSLALTPGPYFLSEMLESRLTLVNNSQRNVYPGSPFSGSRSCGYYPGVEINYTGNPEFNIPIAFDHSCPYSPDRPVTLKPGQDITFTGYIPLQQSGQLTLTAPVYFYTGPASQQLFPGPTSVPDPFGNVGLVAHIQVSKAVPANLKIPFKVQGYNAIVEAPESARGPLLYAYSIGCQDYNNDGGSTWSGNFGWDRLTNATIRRPGCPGKNLQWSFAFAIPGYAVAVGSDNDPVKS